MYVLSRDWNAAICGFKQSLIEKLPSQVEYGYGKEVDVPCAADGFWWSGPLAVRT